MKLSQFRYNLPQELIALYPTENRDESRLMVINRKNGTFEHRIFKEITDYFHEHDVLVFNNTNSRGRTLRFLFDGTYEEFKQTLYSLGETPLPKFINRPVEPEDNERYQTIFAKYEGAVAAPTAGLHFSRELLKKLEIIGVEFAEITLHVGLGNFRSVDVEDLTKHKVDSERIIISEEAAEIVNKAKDEKQRICAVGTTVVRT